MYIINIGAAKSAKLWKGGISQNNCGYFRLKPILSDSNDYYHYNVNIKILMR